MNDSTDQSRDSTSDLETSAALAQQSSPAELRNERSLTSFMLEVLELAATLTYQGPCLGLQEELEIRCQAVRAFFDRWIAHPRVGRATKHRLELLECALLEPGWLGHCASPDDGVRWLRNQIRGKARAVPGLPLKPELLANVEEQGHEISFAVDSVTEPERSYLVGRLSGEPWDTVRKRLGHDSATMRRVRRRLRSTFAPDGSNPVPQAYKVRERNRLLPSSPQGEQ